MKDYFHIFMVPLSEGEYLFYVLSLALVPTLMLFLYLSFIYFLYYFVHYLFIHFSFSKFLKIVF